MRCVPGTEVHSLIKMIGVAHSAFAIAPAQDVPRPRRTSAPVEWSAVQLRALAQGRLDWRAAGEPAKPEAVQGGRVFSEL